MESQASTELRRRVHAQLREWHLEAEHSMVTETSVVVFGERDGQKLVAKIARNHGDEWRSAEVTQAFGGNGVVRVYDIGEGAVLLECLNPGTSLVPMVLGGRDERATEILAGVIAQMTPERPVANVPTVADWNTAIERYLLSGDSQIPRNLLDDARDVYAGLHQSPRRARLLHGDLHHYNVLFDTDRGWVAIDPKGVAGELEYEIGACLRNPWERPDLLARPAIIRSRMACFGRALDIDTERTLAWAFVQAVLAVVWCVEDGEGVAGGNPALMLAGTIRPMLSKA